MARRGYVLTVPETFFVVIVLSCMPCVYAKIMCLACANGVPKALRSFFPNLHRLFGMHRATHWSKPHAQERSRTEI